MLSCPPSWIFVDMHDTSQMGSRDFFLTTQWLIRSHNRMYGKCIGFQHDPEDFKQYLIVVASYLGVLRTDRQSRDIYVNVR